MYLYHQQQSKTKQNIIFQKMVMVNAGGKPSKQELADAEAHVLNHTFNFINSMSLKCAIQLGIPDAIHKHGKPMTLSELADALPINKAKSNGLYRLMRILTHSKFFDKVKLPEDEDEEEVYCLTWASRLLLEGPMSGAPPALFVMDTVLMDPWHHMSEWFQNDGASSFETKHGRTVWEHAGKDGRFNGVVNEAMAKSDAGLVTSILTEECRQVFEGLKTMVDVAGGTGNAAKAIGAAFPGLKCIVFDLPHVVAGLEGSENLTFVGGNMLESIPQAGAVLLKWALHAWSDEDCVRILKKCKEAIIGSKEEGGKVIIVEVVVNDQKEDDVATGIQLFLDMQMMVQSTGKERTRTEWIKIFVAAGFDNYKITPLLGIRSVIELFPTN